MRIDDGRQVKAARAILGMTAVELAKASGVSKNTVLRIESFKRIRRTPYDRNSGVAHVERAIEERGIICEMVEGQPVVRFTTTAPPPKYQRRVQ